MRAEVPRLIWILWLQGWDKAPEIVRACLKTWRHRNPGWTVRAISAEDLADLIGDTTVFSAIAGKDLPPEATSNVIRIALLQQHGGVWADSTTYCLRPLDHWLPHYAQGGFFAFANPSTDRLLSSWFLAAARGNYIVKEWASRTRNYWSGRETRDEYFWFHRLFAENHQSDPAFRELWDAAPKLAAAGPHHYLPQDVKLFQPLAPEDRELIETAAVPLLKLSHKLPAVDYPPGSVIRYLCARADERVANRSWRALRDRILRRLGRVPARSR